MRTWLLSALTILVISGPAWAGQAGTTGGSRRISELAGDLYRFHDGESGEMTVFAVMSDGIVLVDPLNEAAATWLKAELSRRYPDRSVRWIVHTHHHYDRAAGASIFEGATTIGQRRFNALLEAARRRLPPDVAALDLNDNNRLERAEFAGDSREPQIRARDQGNDGFVYPDEFYREVDGVGTTYNATFAIPLGGRNVRLIHAPAHSPDMTAVHFPAERLVFVVDAIHPATFSASSVRVREALEWTRTVEALDFDTLLTDTNETLTKQDLQSLRAYLEDLLDGVADGYAAGRPVSEVQATLTLDSHQGSPAYARRAVHIAETYGQLRSRVFEVYGGPTYVSTRPTHTYCSEAYTACGWTSRMSAGTGGVVASFDWLTVAAEITVAEQTLASRTSALYDDAFAHRESGWSILGGYRSRRHGRMSYVALGGVSMMTVDVQGLYRIKETLASFGGRGPINAHGSRKAVVAGGDAVWLIANRLALTVPVRISFAMGNQPLAGAAPFAVSRFFGPFGPTAATPPVFWPGRMSVQAGVGLRVPLFRRVD
jgi:glyoxylase-like metal-dependent hydrolase (beta-lactamase superfamily II)